MCNKKAQAYNYKIKKQNFVRFIWLGPSWSVSQRDKDSAKGYKRWRESQTDKRKSGQGCQVQKSYLKNLALSILIKGPLLWKFVKTTWEIFRISLTIVSFMQIFSKQVSKCTIFFNIQKLFCFWQTLSKRLSVVDLAF